MRRKKSKTTNFRSRMEQKSIQIIIQNIKYTVIFGKDYIKYEKAKKS